MGGTFDIEMKCTESEEEKPTHSKENFLQLSCFISQEVKYMLSGIKSVRDILVTSLQQITKLNRFSIETSRAIDETVSNLG